MHARVSTPRWMAVGRSDNPDARTAGAEAIKAALAQGGADLRLVICFAADRYDGTARSLRTRGVSGFHNQTLVVLAVS